ncbi:hypothetical protein WN944_008068 [Citrus x changshan-huyou]|uniref:Uncharacterized protein n=1 Tax=Citrus x changshan-huyou TaxID=2935761 RepID=A0AAP0QUV9_9ROSI
MAVVVSLSFPPPTPFWLRHARATVKNKPSNQKIIKRYDAGFWSSTDMQQQFVKVLNLASHMAGVIIGYGDETYTTRVGKLFTLEDARYGKLLAEPYVVHVKDNWRELPDQERQWEEIRVESESGTVPPIWCVDTGSNEWGFSMLNASYASMEHEVKDNRLDLRQFITPLTGMDATEDPTILNSELEYIVRETGQKPMAVVVFLSFPPPTPFWLRHAEQL